MILTADWHLTDKPEDEYRWSVFDALNQHAKPGETIYVLGDLTDRKNRHSADLVNRLTAAFVDLCIADHTVYILMGNHDAPLTGEPFWNFLNHCGKELYYLSEPHADGSLLLLPWVANPREAWKGLGLDSYDCLLIHQPVSGASLENGTRLSFDDNMPLLPRHLKVYAGDIHAPQTVGRVRYVGAPHPVKFGDTYPCQMLRMVRKKSFDIDEVIRLSPPQKLIVEVSSLDELMDVQAAEGDQVRVRFTMPLGAIGTWDKEQDAIQAWAKDMGVKLASVEAIIETGERDAGALGDYLAHPADILRDFASAEAIEADMLAHGLRYLEQVP